ncbi:MAG TPA: DUF6438 domain-containing protein [Blastocatellia bacterium]|nr:DUF6438 domain-containing protein [Blastocatellia bacterium]
MKCAFSVFIALLFVATGCGHFGFVHGQQSTTRVEHFDKLLFERTFCFGKCPCYKLTVDGGGRVEFEGGQWVEAKGRQTSVLSNNQMAELTRALNQADFLSLRDKYMDTEDGCPTWWTDNPSVIITLVVNGKEKMIRHDYGCRYKGSRGVDGNVFPEGLTRLESRIDEIIGTAKWIGSSPEPKMPSM